MNCLETGLKTKDIIAQNSLFYGKYFLIVCMKLSRSISVIAQEFEDVTEGMGFKLQLLGDSTGLYNSP